MFLWNEETLLKFFGRWAKVLDFWCEFFVKISQKCSLQLQRNVLMFFFRREEYLFDRFWSLSENNRHLTKNLAFGSFAKSAFHVSSAKLWEKMTKVIKTIIISFGTLIEFFLILSKKIVRCVETVIKCTERKTSKNTLEKLVFRFSWTLTRKSCSFTGEILAVLSKLLSTCPKETLKSNISERKSWKLQDFRLIFEVFGTMAEIFFQGWQSTNRCPREHFCENFFPKRDIRYFFRFWAIFLLLAKTFAWFAKPAI